MNQPIQEPTVKVEYVGQKPLRQDTLTGTGIVWYGNGDIQDVPESAAQRLARHPDVWRLVTAATQPLEAKPVPSKAMLLGVDLPAEIQIGDRSHALGDLTVATVQENGLSDEEWNALDDADRKELVNEHIEKLQAAAAPKAAKKAAPAKKVAAKKTAAKA